MKSILAGLAAFVLALILYAVAIIGYIRFYFLPTHPPPGAADVGFDLSSMGIALWPALILAVAAFAAGFYAMFRWSSVTN